MPFSERDIVTLVNAHVLIEDARIHFKIVVFVLLNTAHWGHLRRDRLRFRMVSAADTPEHPVTVVQVVGWARERVARTADAAQILRITIKEAVKRIAFISIDIAIQEVALRRELPLVHSATFGVQGSWLVYHPALIDGRFSAVKYIVGEPIVLKRLMTLIDPLSGPALGHELPDRLGLPFQLALVVVELLHQYVNILRSSASDVVSVVARSAAIWEGGCGGDVLYNPCNHVPIALYHFLWGRGSLARCDLGVPGRVNGRVIEKALAVDAGAG